MNPFLVGAITGTVLGLLVAYLYRAYRDFRAEAGAMAEIMIRQKNDNSKHPDDYIRFTHRANGW